MNRIRHPQLKPQATFLQTFRHCRLCVALGLLAAISFVSTPSLYAGKNEADETYYSDADFKRLEPFEAHRLSAADTLYNDEKFAAAAGAFDAFILEFPDSEAIPYAILKKGRSLHREHKRYEAIKVYQEVLDYFPDVINYASPALYYIGLAHQQNGSRERALKSWAKLAADKEYREHPLAARTLNELAQYHSSEGDQDKAAETFALVAETFRKKNPQAAHAAIDYLQRHYTTVKPNEEQLAQLYKTLNSFDDRPREVKADEEEQKKYWRSIFESLDRYGRFDSRDDKQKEQGQKVYSYWANKMRGDFEGWDDYQLKRIVYQFRADQDQGKFRNELEQQFKRGKQNSPSRAIKWLPVTSSDKKLQEHYFRKLDLKQLDAKQSRELVRITTRTLKNNDLTQTAISNIPLQKFSDEEKVAIGRETSHGGSDAAVKVFRSISDKDLANFQLLEHYSRRRDVDEGVKVADKLTDKPKYASHATWMKAELLYHGGKYPQAVEAYRVTDRQPDSSWRIAESFSKMGKTEQAVSELRQVEGFLKKHAPEAALRVAKAYEVADMKDKRIAALRNVLKKYPKSKQSSAAHQQLEQLGIQIGGGLDAE